MKYKILYKNYFQTGSSTKMKSSEVRIERENLLNSYKNVKLTLKLDDNNKFNLTIGDEPIKTTTDFKIIKTTSYLGLTNSGAEIKFNIDTIPKDLEDIFEFYKAEVEYKINENFKTIVYSNQIKNTKFDSNKFNNKFKKFKEEYNETKNTINYIIEDNKINKVEQEKFIQLYIFKKTQI